MEITLMSEPVAIGGVGGSGTRVVAEILKLLGFYIGNDLNSANDNLWFTLLFKRPRWFLKNKNNPEEILQYCNVFERIMKGEYLSSRDYLLIIKAAFDISSHGHNVSGTGKGLWPFKRVFTILINKNYNINSFRGYGWKEPNTHVFLPFIVKHFKNIRYIHVIRNGLDMAFSSNQNQLYNWGKIYDITVDTRFNEGDFIEVYVRCPVEICEQRDPKGQYKKARQGLIKGYTGIDAPYEEPEDPELILDTSRLSIEESVREVYEYLKARGWF
jgi:hypothetical protein